MHRERSSSGVLLRADAVGLVLVLLFVGGIVALIQGQERRMEAVMRAWVGRDVKDLLATWGPPHQTLQSPGEKDATIYVYTDESKAYTPGQLTIETKEAEGQNRVDARLTLPEEIRSYAYRMFWVDKDGRIYRTSWRGLVQSPRLPNLPPPGGGA